MVSRLSIMGRVVLALLAVFFLGGVAASAAQAVEKSLRWKVEGAELKENQTREITVTRWSANPATSEPIILSSGKLVIKCEVASTAVGKSFLANEKVGATSRAISVSQPEFSKCKQEKNGAEPGCKVEEPIKAEPVVSELVLSDNEPGIGKKVLGVADPIKGSRFLTIKFREEVVGISCKFGNAEVTGLVVGSGYTDPLAPGAPTSPEQIERGVNATTEYSSALVKGPDEPKSVYLWKLEGTTEEFKLFEPTGIKLLNEKASLTGTTLISLAKNGKPNGEKAALVE